MKGAYLGEIGLFPYSPNRYTDEGWLECKGQLLSSHDYPDLFSLLGTTYGENETNCFSLPHLAGKEPIPHTKYYICIEGGKYPSKEGNSDRYIGSIGLFPNSKVPGGWTLCDGRELKIQLNAPLFSLLSSTYGGDGSHTFALPNLIEEGMMLDIRMSYYIYSRDDGIYPIREGGRDFPDGYYLGEISMFAFNFSPGTFRLCNGEILNIQENQELYSLIDTRFGGDGKKTFALPNLKDASEQIKLLYAIADINEDDPVSPF